MNLGEIVTRSASKWPNYLALVDDQRSFTYAQLERRTNRLASGLRRAGLAAGAHIAIQAWNRAEIVESEIALYKGGYVKIPINARLTVEETLHVLNDSCAEAVIIDSAHAPGLIERRDEIPKLKHVILIDGAAGDLAYEALIDSGEETPTGIEVGTDNIAVLHYTSGSSGVLKAAMQSFGNRKCNLDKYNAAPWRQCLPGDIMAHVGPLTHASGLFALQVLARGGCNRIFARFDARALLQAIEREKINRLFLVPTMVNRLVNEPDAQERDLSSLNSVFYAASPMAPSLLEKALKLFGPIMVQGYGSGETCALVTMLNERDHQEALAGDKKRLSSCGRSYYDDDEVRVVDDDGQPIGPGGVGEIVVKGPTVMKGYWRAPELTAAVLKNGFYHTGDLATVDEEGYLYIVDRKKEMIISGGFNVYPLEVEKVLYAHPAVLEAAAVGVPNEQWGEEVKAVVVLKHGARVTAVELLSHCRQHLAGFKQPKSVDLVDELPKNDAGKVVRRLIRNPYWAGQARNVG
ncbi:MAG: AMP-dependent synthetase [Betaproteobacteria bacterium RIFCSPLOWO2_12_FULL_65_14]|nr:MAG: AMP-dependent synthetase [Betaproteobacteria bacterium RIFCSPLOWO2_12_FULL_65_14]